MISDATLGWLASSPPPSLPSLQQLGPNHAMQRQRTTSRCRVCRLDLMWSANFGEPLSFKKVMLELLPGRTMASTLFKMSLLFIYSPLIPILGTHFGRSRRNQLPDTSCCCRWEQL